MKEKLISYFNTRLTYQKIFIVASLLATLVLTAFLFLIILVWTGLLGSLPDKDELRSIENPIATEVYSADSVLLGKYFIQERSNVMFNQIPKHVIDALIATEDVRFYKHSGIDNQSFIRVLVKSILLQNESSGGGSTITQQLAKNLYPRKDYIFFSLAINKIREAIIAKRLENVYDKNGILTLYLNTIPFGDNTFGIEAAAQRFFSLPTKLLTIDKGAVLIGMLKASYAYNPRIFPERATIRRNVVLAQMKKYKMLSEEVKDSLQTLPIKLDYNRITHHSGLAPYFREYIRKELQEWCSTNTKTNGKPYNLFTDGLKIYTTINARLQRYAENAVNSQMTALQEKFNNHWGKIEPWRAHPNILNEAIKKSDRYRNLQKRGLSEDEINKVMNTPVLMSVFTWKGEKEIVISPIDSIKHYLKFLNSGLLAVDPVSGSVLAWVGGINHYYFQYDHIKESTKRQVGSIFKPIVYAAALEQGAKPCDFISAEKVTYQNMNEWKPENTEENYDLKFSMEGALAYSVNTVSVKVLEKAGIANTIAIAHKMGVNSTLPAYPSLALGTADVSMLEMVTSYACLVNNGKPVKPFYITSITTHTGTLLKNYSTQHIAEQAISVRSAQLIVHMLKRTINEGTAASLRSRYGIQNDIAGKTGTTQSNADGWFIAMTPNMVIGAWVGSDNPGIRFRSTALGQGAATALPIIAKVFQQVNDDPKLESITRATFPELPYELAKMVSCDLYKSDMNFLQKIFGKSKKEKDKRHAFGEKKKKGFWKRMFE